MDGGKERWTNMVLGFYLVSFCVQSLNLSALDSQRCYSLASRQVDELGLRLHSQGYVEFK